MSSKWRDIPHEGDPAFIATESGGRPRKPSEILGPVSWGFGRNFLGGLTRTLAFDWFPDRLDPRDWMSAESVTTQPAQPSMARADAREFWFDYISDMGDSFRATYSAYYLLHGDLFVDDPRLLSADEPTLTPPGRVREWEIQYRGDDFALRLPTGAFLFCGGDAAYSVADEKTLRARLQTPCDLAHAARRPGNQTSTRSSRPLYGIPANHDWYDSLDGYNRLFRIPPSGAAPVIQLAGFTSVQQASYVAIDLPFDWCIWGIDSRDSTDVDFRQKQFFKRHAEIPKRLVVVTSKPLVVYNETQSWAAQLLAELGLELEPRPPQARLYVSGDSHHYARYGLGSGAFSIVSGLGGATLHPPPHLAGHATQSCDAFPHPKATRRTITSRLANPVHMLLRSGVTGIGAVVGAVVGASLCSYEGELSRSLVRAGWLTLGAPRLPDGVAWVFWAAMLLLFTVGAWFGVGHRLFQFDRSDGEQRARRGWSKVARGFGLVAVTFVFSSLAILVAVWLGGGRSTPGVTLDLLVYVILITLGPGLGPIALLQSHNRQQLHPARQAASLVLGTLSGCAMVGALLFVAARLASALAPHEPLHSLIQSSLPPTPRGVLAYVLLTALGALLGGVVGAIVIPVLFGWAMLIQYALGAHYSLPGTFALLDDYVCFIRFRVRELASGATDLTGFVIGARSVARGELMAGRTPAPRAHLIDVFRIRG
ncbi:MAG TPA: hypothetical protein VFQ61_25560 [Polyangiaceae bacterium]|nr:hypothetical protein [Polyangiaceae bacterium]